jgi:PBSX family phage terminase large subunit
MQLTKKQLLSIADSTAFINIWEGSVRSGKTYASIVAWGKFIMQAPPGELMIVGRTSEAIVRNVVKPMQELYKGYVSWAPGKRILTLCDREVWVVGAADERAAGKIQGSTLIGAYVDEISLIPRSFFDMLLSRLSLEGARLFGTTNPDSPFHWLKEKLDQADGKYLKFWHFDLNDNPYLPQGYVDNIKRSYSGLWYKRFIEGKWVLAEGTIYDFFDSKKHVIDFPTSMAKFHVVGIDYGTTNPTAFVLIGVNPNSYPNVWVESEYYWDSKAKNRQKTDYEYAEDLKKFIGGKNIRAVYLDPSAASFKAELRRIGIDDIYDANNDVLDGIRFVSTQIASGRVTVCASCTNLIKEFGTYCWDEKSRKLGIDKPLKENDHLLDALRYGLYNALFDSEGSLSTPESLELNYREAMGFTSHSGFFGHVNCL